MTQTYRERATQAEQENARLRDELARRPKYEWFVELIRRHLGQSAITHPTHLAHQVKQLKEARGHLVPSDVAWVYRVGNPENDECHFTSNVEHAMLAAKNGYEVHIFAPIGKLAYREDDKGETMPALP